MMPKNLVDIQIAEGLRGRSYPLSYNAIVERVLGTVIGNSQTRTDWIRRPLSPEQIQYALEDVSPCAACLERQKAWLEKKGRLGWATSEFQRMCQDITRKNRSSRGSDCRNSTNCLDVDDCSSLRSWRSGVKKKQPIATARLAAFCAMICSSTLQNVGLARFSRHWPIVISIGPNTRSGLKISSR